MVCDAILAEDGFEQVADVFGGGAFREPVRFVRFVGGTEAGSLISEI